MRANGVATSRRCILTGIAGLAAAALAGCGFHLRGKASLPFERIWLSADRNSRFGSEVAGTLRASSNVRIVDKQDEAQALLTIGRESRTSGVAVINPQGRAREYELELSIQFKLTTPDGFELIPLTTLRTRRDLEVKESDHLARRATSEMLYRDMQRELINRIVMTISRTKLHERPVD